jgi:hypothetical protein
VEPVACPVETARFGGLDECLDAVEVDLHRFPFR